MEEKSTDKRERSNGSWCEGLCMTNRSMSVLVAGALLAVMSIFFVGFFVGQRSAAQQFIDRADQGAFADHIYAAMCGLSGATEEDESTNSEAGESESEENGTTVVTGAETQAATTPEAVEQEEVSREVAANECEYYAQLIGFGTAKAAQDFVNRLKKKGIPVFVQKRHSRSAKGRMATWYQVVTEKFRDEEKLQALVATLKEEEKLQGIHVVAC